MILPYKHPCPPTRVNSGTAAPNCFELHLVVRLAGTSLVATRPLIVAAMSFRTCEEANPERNEDDISTASEASQDGIHELDQAPRAATQSRDLPSANDIATVVVYIQSYRAVGVHDES